MDDRAKSNPGRSRWRGISRAALAVLMAAGVIVLFYAEEDLRGIMAWKHFVAARAAKGVKVETNINDLIPVPVPDDQNFAATPFWRYVFSLAPSVGVSYSGPTNEYYRATQVTSKFDFGSAPSGGWWRARHVGLPSYVSGRRLGAPVPSPVAQTNPATMAEEMLRALEPFEPLRKEMLAASVRPLTRFDVNYTPENPFAILLPHLTRVKMGVQTLRLRCAAELALGREIEAFEDLEIALRLVDALEPERFIISGLFRSAALEISMQTIWEGVEGRQWSGSHLVKIQKRLARINLLRDADLEMETELAAANQTMELVRRRPKTLGVLGVDPDRSDDLAFVCAAIPTGWIYLEERNYNLRMVEARRAALDPVWSSVRPRAIQAAESGYARAQGNVVQQLFHHEALSSLMFPSIQTFLLKMAHTQAAASLGQVGCALERYRLVYGDVPDNLAQLIRHAFIAELPKDVIGGGPLHYRRRGPDAYDLYSIGWNEKDDNGTVGYNSNSDALEIAQGDWVWSIPDPGKH